MIIPDILPHADALALGHRIRAADWVDGNVTSGEAAALAKHNRQLPEASSAARDARHHVQKALSMSAAFLSAALPRIIYPPLFNLYGVGDGFGDHVDNAIRVEPQSGQQMRTDLSATLFLSDPQDYEGGELCISSQGSYKLAAGAMLLYPATSLHYVSPITRGERIASFFWVQSLVRDDALREILFDMDQVTQRLSAEKGGADADVLRLTRAYHNLVRHCADV
jgi:PKHD-type hydroxylase